MWAVNLFRHKESKMKVKIKVTYEGGISNEKDQEIQKKMRAIGAEWYAQGTDLRTGERDLCFDLELLE